MEGWKRALDGFVRRVPGGVDVLVHPESDDAVVASIAEALAP